LICSCTSRVSTRPRRADKILKATAEPIDAPSHDDVEFTPGCSFVESIESWPLILGLGAGNPVVLVDLHNLPAGPLGDVPQLALLVGGGLVLRRNPEIQNRALHRSLPR
jgi:hypothetical protein